GGQVIAEIDHLGKVQNVYGYAASGLVARYAPQVPQVYIYTFDPMGNVCQRHTTTLTPRADFTTVYDAYGTQLGQISAASNLQLPQNGVDSVGYSGQWG